MADFNVQEWGIVGVLITLFAGQIMFLQKTLMRKLVEVFNISIKLIDRWNRSDEVRDRRHEKLVEELNDLGDIVMEIKGSVSRINGKN
jgi:uncharacterized protein YllA (UPF0747 family)|tara:strand:- start:1883 stop:2146 length:264 start_codon:yes stop_codon:yes gene_type:complete